MRGRTNAGTVIVVDDDVHTLRALARTLSDGFEVATYESGEEAVTRILSGGVAAVVSDIAMPGMSGLELLRSIRNIDTDLPVLLITGLPSVESASKAIEYGVFRYLQKPFALDEVRGAVRQAAQLYRLARMKREALELEGRRPGASDRIGLEVTFRRAIESLWVAFQPIVSISERRVFGYEALMRSADPALPDPNSVLDAAERLGKLEDVGRLVRSRIARVAGDMSGDELLFLNLHPRDLLDPELADSDSVLARIAERVVLEITERASLAGLDDVQARVANLRRLGFRIAIDDLGAGYAGLTSFALLEPEIVKIDMSLTRGIGESTVRQKLVGSLSNLCREMNMTVVAEGVETSMERDTLCALGCDLLQGYAFAKPAWPIPDVRWP